jgi:hypothetical protein
VRCILLIFEIIKIERMKKIFFLNTALAIIVFLFIAVLTPILFIACQKEGKDKIENACPLVAANLVPQVIKDSFAVRYPATSVTTWFNKDSVGYCAYFITTANIEKLTQFANNGSFVKEEIEIHQNGEHQDSTGTGGKVTGGCECETHKESD